MTGTNPSFPRLTPVGLDGLLITFSDQLSEPANRAALALRASIDALDLAGVQETTTSLTSTFVIFDPAVLPRDVLSGKMKQLLDSRDWATSPLPQNRRLWQVPAAFDGPYAPQLAEAAVLAGLPVETAVADLCAAPLRVLTIGFAPGQPYLGSLAAPWDIPRQTGITRQVPVGAITVAIRQIVLFSTPNPTGWRQVGQCGFRSFRPDNPEAFTLRPGDEMHFHPVSPSELETLLANDPNQMGGARCEPVS